MDKIERFLGELTQDETQKLVIEALMLLSSEAALAAIKQWAEDTEMVDELKVAWD